MKPLPHQLELSKEGIGILKEHMLLYLAWEERTMKTLTSILIADGVNTPNVLVLTKKKALEGWHDTLREYKARHVYTVTNYHQAHKLSPIYDLVILDEAHNYISGVPDPSKFWYQVRKLTKGRPIIYLSATPYAQGYHLLYHQLALSDWSPWGAWKVFRHWFAEFGRPKNIYVNSRLVPQYDDIDPRCFEFVEHLFITKTRKELDFEYEPEDKVHYVELADNTKAVYNYLLKHKAANLNGEDLVCDTSMKLRTSLHMLEGGVMLVSKPHTTKTGKKSLKRTYHQLGNTEKIDYILNNWGDNEETVIMYNYIAEREKLLTYFKHALVLQATSNAEGIDLSKRKHLIIYSQDFSTARHTQRRARQANKFRNSEIIVHFLLVRKAISDQVYETVSVNKQNFVDKLFKRRQL